MKLFLSVLIICLSSIKYCKGYDDYEDILRIQNKTDYLSDYYDIEWLFNKVEDDNIPAKHHDHHHDTTPATIEDDEEFDSWSIVWYIASFGGLIAFFLIVSCSEWCCRKRIRDNQNQTPRSNVSPSAPTPTVETPPPAYDLFAPPSYESLNSSSNNEKNEYDIYVVPVHALGSLVQNQSSQQEEHPPSYTSINIEGSNRSATTT